MYKEYKINIFRAGYIFGIIITLFLTCVGIYGLYSTLRVKAPFFVICIGIAALSAVIFVLFLSLFYFLKLKISINGENIIYSLPHKIVTFSVNDIYKIEKDFSYAGVGYYVFFYDDKRKKRHIKFTQDIEDSEGLIKYLQNKSSVKMRQEGTLDVENEKSPTIKALKIALNIIITLIILGLLVLWPLLN